MKFIDMLAALMIAAIVMTVLIPPAADRQIALNAQQCWDSGYRAVYVRIDGEYGIRCES